MAVCVSNDNERPFVIEDINGTKRVACGSKDHYFGDVRIVNPETCHAMPDGEEGEIWVSGPAAAIGYWGNEDDSKKTFCNVLKSQSDRPFLFGGDGRFVRTGDIGAWKVKLSEAFELTVFCCVENIVFVRRLLFF